MISEILSDLLKTSGKFVEIAHKILQSCLNKKNKVHSESRLIISFFFRRGLEIFETLIILLENMRYADGALLLRSFWEMGISSGYIFFSSESKELNTLRYLLQEQEERKKIINANLQEFKEFDSNIESKRDQIADNIKEIKAKLCEKYCEQDMELPPIEQRAIQSGSEVLKQAYNQVYRYTSNIEHHNYFFGINYVDEENCEPLREIKDIALTRPEINLIMARSILLALMNYFNDEFKLNWGEKISNLQEIQDEEYNQLKRKKF